MKKYRLKIAVLILGISVFCPGCTSKFDKINKDPDRPSVVPATNQLAYIIRYSSSTLFDDWNDMNEPSTYAGFLTKIQYIDESRYVFRSGNVENKWEYCNMLLSNIASLKEEGEKDNKPNLLNLARTWEAVIMSIMTDTWRNVPYSDAMRMEEGILLPKYDTQEEIYPALLAVLKKAADGFDAGGTDNVGEGDILYHGNIRKWQQLCNSLRLRLAIRISKVAKDLARQTVEEILTNPAKYPLLLENEDNAFFWWPGSSPYIEPWANNSESRDDHAVSDILVNFLKENKDPRLPVYAKPQVDNEYVGFTIGAVAQPALNSISRIGKRFRDDKAGFTPYMRACETWFHIAEASKLGWKTGSTTKNAYEKAVTLSLEENGIAAEEIATFLAGNARFNDTFEQIWWQEWVSLFKQGMEGWSLYRRTGIPSTHYVAPGSPYSGHNVPPFRYPYPDSESSLNKVNVTPHKSKVVDYFWGQQMWWDTRTGVQ